MNNFKVGDLIRPKYSSRDAFNKLDKINYNQINRYIKVFDDFNDYVHFFTQQTTFIEVVVFERDPGIIVDDVCYAIVAMISKIDDNRVESQDYHIPMRERMLGHRFVKVMYANGEMMYHPDWAIELVEE